MNWEYILLQRLGYNLQYLFCASLRRNDWRRMLILIVLFFASTSVCFSLPDETQHQFIEYLNHEKADLTHAIAEAKATSVPKDKKEVRIKKQQNELMLTLVRAKIENLQGFLANQRDLQQQLMRRLKQQQQAPLNKQFQVDQAQIIKINELVAINQKILRLIQDNLSLADQYRQALLETQSQLDIWQAKFEVKDRYTQLNKRVKDLKIARNKIYQKNIQLQKNKKYDANFNDRINYEAKILLNNQIIILLQHRITELKLRKNLIQFDYKLLENQDYKTIQTIVDTYKHAIEELDAMSESLKKMADLLKSEQILTQSNQKKQLQNLQKTIQTRLQEIAQQKQNLQQELEYRQQQLKKVISARQSLSEYHLSSFPNIVKQLIFIPTHLYNYHKLLLFKLKEKYLWQSGMQKTIFWLGLVVIVLAGACLSRLLKVVIRDKERSRLSAHLYDGILMLLYRNMVQMTAIALIIFPFYFNNLAFSHYRILVNLLLVWFVFRNLILIARLTLLERISDASGKDVRLYYRLRWLLIAGGWSTALMVLSHQLPLSYLMQDLFNRVFMIFLLALAVLIWKSKDLIPYLLRPILKAKKKYIKNSIKLLVILIPLTLSTTALFGLSGYMNLAWTMSWYQMYLLMVITCYILALGILVDALELLSEWMISSLRNGWLWIEVFLKPLDKILRILLLVISVILIFQLFGWYSDSWVMENLKQLSTYPFINFPGIHISFINTIEFLILLSILLWAAKWTREFCYRWLYRNSRDAGVRNSLSVFTQYAVVLTGGFITLRVLGIDFSGISMILGGLAVGMGFGLRDFASNIIGGIMLLIERPVREGDLITLGEYEGRVAHIGIRSMRVSSWDNMEVLIPNAETFNKPFTNWTHQDNVVRTVIPIKVCRTDDPFMVQQLILDVLAIIPEVLNNPPPQVFLKQIDEALIEFEVRYFINVELHTRFEVRSKALFAMNAQFKAAGIKPPIPPFTVELRESHDNDKQQPQISKRE